MLGEMKSVNTPPHRQNITQKYQFTLHPSTKKKLSDNVCYICCVLCGDADAGYSVAVFIGNIVENNGIVNCNVDKS